MPLNNQPPPHSNPAVASLGRILASKRALGCHQRASGGPDLAPCQDTERGDGEELIKHTARQLSRRKAVVNGEGGKIITPGRRVEDKQAEVNNPSSTSLACSLSTNQVRAKQAPVGKNK